MTVRGRATVGRDVHVDETEAAGGVTAGEKDGVGIADEAYVGEGGAVGCGSDEHAGEVVGREGRGCLRGLRGVCGTGHRASPEPKLLMGEMQAAACESGSVH